MEGLVDNERELRYEWWEGGERVGSIAYRTEPGVRVLVHTEVDPSYKGQGLGNVLVQGALDDLRERGLAMRPVCPFVTAYLRRHPQA